MTSFSIKRAPFIFMTALTIMIGVGCLILIFVAPTSEFALKAWGMIETMWVWWAGVSVVLFKGMVRRRDPPDIEAQIE